MSYTVYKSDSYLVQDNDAVVEVINLHTGDRSEFTYSHAASIKSNISQLVSAGADVDDYLSQYFGNES